MVKRRIVRRRVRTAPQQPRAVQATELTGASLGLSEGQTCDVLVVGSDKYCSFILARLSRLGHPENIGITSAEWHALWAVKTHRPSVVITSVDYDRRSGGIDLAHKLQAANPSIGVILTSSALDHIMDERTMRDFAWSMADSWSFIARRKTDNGDPLGVAMVAAKQGVGWIDYTVRKKILSWREATRGSTLAAV